MPLVDVPVPGDAAPLPDAAAAFVRAGEARIRAFVTDGGGLPGFVPSDFVRVYQALRGVHDARLAPDPRLCEWGSGFGVVAGLAAYAGFDACGIEIEETLVDEARALAADFELPVEFAHGSFVPAGGDDLTEVPLDAGWLVDGGADGHADLGADPSDFGVVFAYPWPGDEGVVDALFARYAADGALLLTYHGVEDLRLQRKRAAASPA